MLEKLFELTYLRRSDTPQAFLRSGGRGPATETLVVCAGDSITHGSASANYVAVLEQRLTPSGFTFVNAGVNGNLAWNVVQRLDSIVACRPDVVTVLIGTNDVLATFDDKATDRYRKEQGLPRRPDLEWYRENLVAILDRVRAETSARVLVLDLPPLGEDLGGEMNRRVNEYNAVLRAACQERDVPCLPLHDRLADVVAKDGTSRPFADDFALMTRAILSHLFLHRSWDEIARRNGFAVLTDHIHLNDRAAAIVADLVEGALTSD